MAQLRRRVATFFLLATVAVGASCASSSKNATTASSTTSTTSAGATSTTSTTAAAAELPATTVAGSLTTTFASKNKANVPYDPTKLFPAGSVEADWYLSNGFWVVYYKGLDVAATGPLCPGNSIKTPVGFMFESDSPTATGACAGVVSKVATAPVGVRICGNRLLYLTAIPTNTPGTLYGTIEKLLPDGTVIGATSQAVGSHTPPPQINLDTLGCHTVS
jgi:hypothetical protein